jgi:glyoxylase-like metal-dependent hydrolase (beta-lactamase superfamily II)
MTAFICETCGAQHSPSANPPARCAVCEDERQYVGWRGQRWTTLTELRAGHQADIREEEPGLTGIGCDPSFAIGQRALLIASPHGTVMWDCISLIDSEIEDHIRSQGGLAAVAISHPHYYSSMVEYAAAFDAPVYLHAADREWVMREDPRLQFWSGERLDLQPGITLLRLGGHFDGATVLLWEAGQAGAGALLSGDVIQVVQDRRWVSFMRSYPNLIPLPASAVAAMVAALSPYRFERVYGAWYGRVVVADGKAAVERSAARYVAAVASPGSPSAG